MQHVHSFIEPVDEMKPPPTTDSTGAPTGSTGSMNPPKRSRRLRSLRPRHAAVAAVFLTLCAVVALILAGGHDSGVTLPAHPTQALDQSASETTPPIPPVPAASAMALRPSTTAPAWLTKQRAAQAKQEAWEAAHPAPLEPTTSGADPSSTTTQTPRTAAVGTGGSTPLRGIWSGTPQRLADYLLAESPNPTFSVPVLTLAGYYVRYAAEVGLRADVLWAQMLHETGFGRYGGSVVAGQNNFAGIGATGGGEAGSSFPTAEDGVKAQIAHMVAYVFTQDMASWTNATVDPRYDAIKDRGVVRILSDLDGRWAVPGDGYGAAIERLVAAMNR